MLIDNRKWRLIEKEDAEQEGYIIVPADGSFERYASQSQVALFQSEEVAERAIQKLVMSGRAELGSVRPVKARLVHHRTVEVLEEPPVRLVITNDLEDTTGT